MAPDQSAIDVLRQTFGAAMQYGLAYDEVWAVINVGIYGAASDAAHASAGAPGDCETISLANGFAICAFHRLGEPFRRDRPRIYSLEALFPYREVTHVFQCGAASCALSRWPSENPSPPARARLFVQWAALG
jgi:hypothetical protein